MPVSPCTLAYSVALALSFFGAPCAGLRVASIGDFGSGDSNEGRVAAMVAGFAPEEILALGDNNYPSGASSTIDANVGQFYRTYISPYTGSYGAGSANGNHFWPIAGNHDWGNTCGNYKTGCACSAVSNLDAHMSYFSGALNGARYYSKVLGGGMLEVFGLSSDCNEPDGTDKASAQAQWLTGALAASKATWKIVMLHHSPYSSSSHGSIDRVQWGYENMGVDAVLSGHDHTYERVLKAGGFPYIVNGLGGAGIRSFLAPVPGSTVRYNAQHGAQIIDMNATTADLKFYAATTPPTLVDCYRIIKAAGGAKTYGSCTGTQPGNLDFSLLTSQVASNTDGTHGKMVWRYTSAAAPLTSTWMQPSFDSGTWTLGRTRFGYGPDFPYNTTLPAASTGKLHHYFRTSFCLSATRKTWLASQSTALKVLADNGADVYLNGVKLVTDAASNHDAKYWNNQLTVAGDSASFVQGVNWLAVYVSNTAGSSDAAFDLDLTYAAAAAKTEVPGQVTALTATAASTSIMTLKWAKPACDGSSFVTSYTVSISPATVSMPAMVVTDPFKTAYTANISGLAACTTYTFTVRAINAAGQSTATTATAKTSCSQLTQFSLLTGKAASNTTGTHGSMFWRQMSAAASLGSTWMQPSFDSRTWRVGRTRFGYGPDFPYNTALPAASTGKLFHYFRTSFCLSATRKTWLASQSMGLRVLADNGADVYLNGVKLVSDAASNHDGKYWNNQLTVAGNSASFVQGVNWLAVYVSNTAGSSDAAFDLDLTYAAAAAKTEVPGPVTALSAGTITTSSITLRWTKPACDGSSFLTSFAVSSSPAVSVPTVAVIDPFQASYSTVISGLTACKSYTLTVRAVNAAGQSASASISATTTC